MNLIQQAELDLAFTLEDKTNGFGVELSFFDGSLDDDDDPIERKIVCQTTDIGYFLDPQAGIGIAGRQVEITCRISTLDNFNMTYPKKSWTIGYVDTNDKTWVLSIQQVRPDRKLGVYNLVLEGYK
jgi:hypothetical protein